MYQSRIYDKQTIDRECLFIPCGNDSERRAHIGSFWFRIFLEEAMRKKFDGFSVSYGKFVTDFRANEEGKLTDGYIFLYESNMQIDEKTAAEIVEDTISKYKHAFEYSIRPQVLQTTVKT